MARLDADFDPRSALVAYAPGVVLTRAIDDAVMAQYTANGNKALTQQQVLAIVGPLPSYPAGLPRFQDSNPDPFDDWAIDNRFLWNA